MSEDDGPLVTATATLEVVPNGPSKFTVGLAFWSPRRTTVEVRHRHGFISRRALSRFEP